MTKLDVADTEVFRKAVIAYLSRIDRSLGELVKLVEGEPVAITMTKEEFERAAEEFGTTD